LVRAVANNEKTWHFGTLLVHLVESLKNSPADIQELPVKAINTVYFTRVFIKYFTEHATGDQILRMIRDVSGAAQGTRSLRCYVYYVDMCIYKEHGRLSKVHRQINDSETSYFVYRRRI
jgi:hypothetical protein